jgi:hypothetical protein
MVQGHIQIRFTMPECRGDGPITEPATRSVPYGLKPSAQCVGGVQGTVTRRQTSRTTTKVTAWTIPCGGLPGEVGLQ